MSRPDDEQLCVACRLCCDGTMFSRILLTEGDAASARSAKLPVLTDDNGKPVLPQPCPNLGADGRCARYDERPVACRNFVCRLLREQQEGVVDHDEAVAVVRRAHELLERLREIAPDRSKPLLPQATAASADAAPERVLDLVELIRVLERRFGFVRTPHAG